MISFALKGPTIPSRGWCALGTAESPIAHCLTPWRNHTLYQIGESRRDVKPRRAKAGGLRHSSRLRANLELVAPVPALGFTTEIRERANSFTEFSAAPAPLRSQPSSTALLHRIVPPAKAVSPYGCACYGSALAFSHATCNLAAVVPWPRSLPKKTISIYLQGASFRNGCHSPSFETVCNLYGN